MNRSKGFSKDFRYQQFEEAHDADYSFYRNRNYRYTIYLKVVDDGLRFAHIPKTLKKELKPVGPRSALGRFVVEDLFEQIIFSRPFFIPFTAVDRVEIDNESGRLRLYYLDRSLLLSITGSEASSADQALRSFAGVFEQRDINVRQVKLGVLRP